ncbi:C45 family peptidase [Cryobacterium sp. PH29-G1]|uniref:C45 family autoproteolytic acyltransferase/hydolase n=1 Tax=Cryobacterium sp. PH29-G1 TaxID=3046211 RepID=UPI0024B950AD|nr:C45 family peptidase [Cryobacterium sp. PH29-G1]MDJ0348655.1 C45 family autoproteolytic acyltransferase/hydrolase [Cryobacterium sp. PH29-G1]
MTVQGLGRSLAPQLISIDSTDAYERGRQRGRRLGDALDTGISVYRQLFSVAGIDPRVVQANAESAIVATEAWSPDLAAELRGTADASGYELWMIAALNARTEILSGANGSTGTKPGECSTIVSTRARPVGAQTWDWHDELADCWHLQQVHGTPHSFVGLTEHGILSKVGVNDAGVGIMLNILGHQADRADGVPVHLVGARVLAEAGTLEEALQILQSAPVSTSSAITVLTPDAAVTVELNPTGSQVVRPRNGILLHTNHFLDPRLGQGEKPGLYDPDSQLRLGVLTERAEAGPLPTGAAQLVPYLVSRPGDVAELCCVPEPGATLGNRWSTLATITLDAQARTMTASAGSPLAAVDDHAPVTVLVAR